MKTKEFDLDYDNVMEEMDNSMKKIILFILTLAISFISALFLM